ncbi:hypothetical protein [Conexibacter arvalis]|uniref:Uncharacterized protein n=1 Tax=Conexibacter arvalis TaxID=912552 RepID=A0A840IC67_9ACTN|nr:hypothetical protein [Conexibacter arvalis]MBB4662312.1 hypothetical protein [Conexibacter arvalis]
MSEDRQNRAPRHPWLDRRSLVLWGGDGPEPADEERDAIGMIALPLRHADAHAALIARARAKGLGVTLVTESWQEQLPVEPLSAAAVADHAERHLDAQLAAGATLATTPAHLVAPDDPAGREQELALAHATVAAWQERQGWRPPPQHPDAGPRELHAALALRPSDLPALPALTERFAELSVDGYWLTLLDTGPAAHRSGAPGGRPLAPVAAPPGGGQPGDSLSRLRAAAPPRGSWQGAPDGRPPDPAPSPPRGGWPGAADGDGWAAALAEITELALELQAQTGRPVAVAGAGAAHAALLASGVAAVCAGPSGARVAFPPQPLDGDGVTGIALPLFHPGILGFVPPGAAHDDARTALFATEPCRCGFHRSFEPPRGRRETLGHNRWWLAAEARDATRLVPALDEIRLASRAARAVRARRRLDLPPLSPAWTAVAETARARRARTAAALA